MASTVRGVTNAYPRPNGGCGSRTPSCRHPTARRRRQGHARSRRHSTRVPPNSVASSSAPTKSSTAPPAGRRHHAPRVRTRDGSWSDWRRRRDTPAPRTLRLPPRAGGRITVQGHDGPYAADQRRPHPHDRIVGPALPRRPRRPVSLSPKAKTVAAPTAADLFCSEQGCRGSLRRGHGPKQVRTTLIIRSCPAKAPTPPHTAPHRRSRRGILVP